MGDIFLAGSTSGTTTLTPTAVSGTTTLTLPATTGTITTKDTNGILSVNGVQFPSTQSASADANCLDDYEEGTWTPTVGGTATYTTASGTYTKVGKLVHCIFEIQINVIGTGSTSVMSGLPFTNASLIASGSVSYYSSLATATNFISCYLVNSSTQINFTGNTASASTIGLNSFVIFGNSTRIIGSVTYQTS